MASALISPMRERVFGVDHGAGRFLEDLLVAALKRAVSLAQVHGPAAAVPEHLNFDVARLTQIFL